MIWSGKKKHQYFKENKKVTRWDHNITGEGLIWTNTVSCECGYNVSTGWWSIYDCYLENIKVLPSFYLGGGIFCYKMMHILQKIVPIFSKEAYRHIIWRIFSRLGNWFHPGWVNFIWMHWISKFLHPVQHICVLDESIISDRIM